MSKLITIIAIAAVASFFLTLNPSGTMAQNDPNVAPVQELPVQPTDINTTTTTTTTNQAPSQGLGFNPMWLLPLLSIPLLFWLFRGSEDREVRESNYYRTAYHDVGRRGRKAREDLDEEDEDTIVEEETDQDYHRGVKRTDF